MLWCILLQGGQSLRIEVETSLYVRIHGQVAAGGLNCIMVVLSAVPTGCSFLLKGCTAL